MKRSSRGVKRKRGSDTASIPNATKRILPKVRKRKKRPLRKDTREGGTVELPTNLKGPDEKRKKRLTSVPEEKVRRNGHLPVTAEGGRRSTEDPLVGGEKEQKKEAQEDHLKRNRLVGKKKLANSKRGRRLGAQGEHVGGPKSHYLFEGAKRHKVNNNPAENRHAVG